LGFNCFRLLLASLLYGVGAPRDLFNVSLASMLAFAGLYLLLFLHNPFCFGVSDAVLQLDFKAQDSKSVFGMFILYATRPQGPGSGPVTANWSARVDCPLIR
jgi:hypothetical protein